MGGGRGGWEGGVVERLGKGDGEKVREERRMISFELFSHNASSKRASE